MSLLDVGDSDVSRLTGEVIKKAMGGGDGNKEEKKKDSGIDVGSIVKNVTGGKDSNKGGG